MKRRMSPNLAGSMSSISTNSITTISVGAVRSYVSSTVEIRYKVVRTDLFYSDDSGGGQLYTIESGKNRVQVSLFNICYTTIPHCEAPRFNFSLQFVTTNPSQRLLNYNYILLVELPFQPSIKLVILHSILTALPWSSVISRPFYVNWHVVP